MINTKPICIILYILYICTSIFVSIIVYWFAAFGKSNMEVQWVVQCHITLGDDQQYRLSSSHLNHWTWEQYIQQKTYSALNHSIYVLQHTSDVMVEHIFNDSITIYIRWIRPAVYILLHLLSAFADTARTLSWAPWQGLVSRTLSIAEA